MSVCWTRSAQRSLRVGINCQLDPKGQNGGIETVFTALAIRNGILPPTINFENPGEECDLDYVPNVARKAEVEYAMSNSFGFGGTNASLILKRYRP